jgi:citrate lyase subunit alpha/citrate CoA-transferase
LREEKHQAFATNRRDNKDEINRSFTRTGRAIKKYVAFTHANATTPYLADVGQKHQRKLCDSLDEMIDRCELRDGMTISFHHAFREGDKVINLVVDKLAALGLKNITLASSSLMTCNAP